jgi:hypothetical protein
VDSAGSLLWDSVGVAICDADSDQEYCSMVPDGKGGAIVTWDDERYYRQGIYVQHIDSSGNCLWDSNGMFISYNLSDASRALIVEDGGGGAIVAWGDAREPNRYAQRVYDVVSVEEERWKGRREKREERLLSTQPNPFVTTTTISLYLPSIRQRAEGIELRIYDISGRRVRQFILHPLSFILSVEWDGRNDRGILLNQGVYFCVLSYRDANNNSYKLSNKIIFIK